MFPSDLENAYAYEVERHNDEMLAALIHNIESQYIKRRKFTALPLAIVTILSLILANLIGHGVATFSLDI